MTTDDRGRAPAWHADDDKPFSLPRDLLNSLVGSALLGVVFFVIALVFGVALKWALLGVGCWTVTSAPIEVILSWFNRREIFAMWVEPISDIPTFTVCRANRTGASYPIAALGRIEVMQYENKLESLTMWLYIGDHVERTREGSAAAAQRLLGLFAEAGVAITTEIRDPD